MATLIVTPFTPREGSGAGLRTVGVTRALARSEDVEIAYVEFGGTQPAAALESDDRVVLRRLRASRGLRRAVTYARARSAGTPRAFARGLSPELVDTTRLASRFDRIIADGPTAAAALVLLAGRDDVVYNAHNLESGFRSELSFARRDFGTPDRLQSFERDLLVRAVETWLPTRQEVTQASRLAPNARVRYVPNVIDVHAISPVSPAGSGRILFVADYSYEPNRNAVTMLVQDVMPLVWTRVPSARLTLVGRSLELSPDVDNRIDVLGYVDRLDGVYASSDCAVVPLRQGGGSPLKLIEAMAYGLPVVATSRAASGLDAASDGVHYIEADGAGPISDALASVLAGEAAEIGRRGRELAETEYSIESLAELIA